MSVLIFSGEIVEVSNSICSDKQQLGILCQLSWHSYRVWYAIVSIDAFGGVKGSRIIFLIYRDILHVVIHLIWDQLLHLLVLFIINGKGCWGKYSCF